MSRPTGTVTFLFTDIEGSTRLWQQFPEEMKEALALHDSLIRREVGARAGHVFKTAGDSFCVAFARAPEAVAAAVAIQRALARDWDAEAPFSISVRMALHTGVADERDEDYFGPPLNLVARLLSVAHGGQILLSSAAAQLAQDSLPAETALKELGEHRLPDIARAEAILQATHPDLRADFPPLRTKEAPPSNLPRVLTSFVGREREIAAVKGMLEDSCLLTLTGVGGCGKTRLALQTAAEAASSFQDGVWLVELAPLSDAGLIPGAVASAMGVREEPGRDLPGTLADHLRDRTALLLLDNCEHLIQASAQIAENLLRNAPRLRILATSREALGVAGEMAWRVPSLSIEDGGAGGEAVRLFEDRARAVVPAFAVAPDNAEAIVQICRRLDGIPLAIELAAARVKVLSVEQIAERLDDRFRLLTGGSRTALPRQQTLRAAIDWSYNLLTESERLLLRRLSVFVGGWSLEAAEAICGFEGIEPWEILDLLTQLVDKSLVVVEEQQKETRYRLLETVRQYAGDRLLDSDEAGPVRIRHSEWFAAWARSLRDSFFKPDWHRHIDANLCEIDNSRAALQWFSAGAGALRDLLDIAAALSSLCISRGRLAEGREYARSVLALPGVEAEPGSLGWLLAIAGMLAWSHGDMTEAGAFAERSMSLLSEQQMNRELAYAMGLLNLTRRSLGDVDGQRDLAERRLEIARRTGNAVALADALRGMGMALHQFGEFDDARRVWLESLDICRSSGYEFGAAQALNSLGEASRQMGNLAEASGFYRESLDLFKRLEVPWPIQMVTLNLAFCSLWLGDTVKAAAHFAEGIRTNRDLGNRSGLSLGLAGASGCLSARGSHTVAARVLGAAAGLIDMLGGVHQHTDQTDIARIREGLQAALGAEALYELIEDGRKMGREEAARLALEQLAA